MNMCCSVNAVLTLISYVPQIVKTIRTKHSEDISIGSWSLWLLGSMVGEVYAIADSHLALFISSSLELFFVLTTLVLAIIYRKR